MGVGARWVCWVVHLGTDQVDLQGTDQVDLQDTYSVVLVDNLRCRIRVHGRDARDDDDDRGHDCQGVDPVGNHQGIPQDLVVGILRHLVVGNHQDIRKDSVQNRLDFQC